MQQSHSAEKNNLYRYRLPDGFSELIEGVGSTFLKARKESFEYGAMSASEFAAVLGVKRETLSRIDNDRRLPAYSTLRRYLDLLGLDIDAIAKEGDSARATIPDYPELFSELGAALDVGRKDLGLTLRQLEEHTGISHSQLSRITRGQFKGGKHVEVKYFDGVRDPDDNSGMLAWFTHPMLDYLSEIGGFRRDLGARLHDLDE